MISKTAFTYKQRPLKLLMINHRWWFPTVVNGADIANHEFARRLWGKGVEVRVFGLVAKGVDGVTRQRSYITDGVKITLLQNMTDFSKKLLPLVEEFRPDLVMTSCPGQESTEENIEEMMSVFNRFSIPVILYAHDLSPLMDLYYKIKNKFATMATNSYFMQKKIKEKWNLSSTVIYPVPRRSLFKVAQNPGPFITFFNPLPHKGRDIVLELVSKKFNDRSFLFVEGFMEPECHGISLIRTGNVVHARRSPDVASVYMMTNILLVPSQWEEPFGRVALEAMYNKIPVVASNTGGLTESVGKGGILITDFTNIDAWVEAIKALDDSLYREKIILAGTKHLKKFSLNTQMKQFNALFNNVLH